jgi:WD40 repeat protein
MSAPVKLVACALTAHKGWVMNLSPFPDGKRVATCGSDRSVKVWDCGMGLASSTPVHSFEGVHDGLVWGLDCGRVVGASQGGFSGGRSSGDRLKLISCGNDGVIQVFSCGE